MKRAVDITHKGIMTKVYTKKKKKGLLVGCSKKEKDFAENNRIVTKYHSLIFKAQVKNPP